MKVTQLNLFPIKSSRAYGVEQAFVRQQGLNFDREFMITEPDGKLMTARKEKFFYQLTACPLPSGLMMVADNGDQCAVDYRDFRQSAPSEVWGSHFHSWLASEAVNGWLSERFGRAVQLRWLGEQSQRQVANFEPNPMSFADSNPISLMSEASLAALQSWSPVPIEMGQFRGNIIIDGELPFAEEQWRRIQIGGVRFRFAQCCTRCVMITRDLHTLELEPNVEPFRTLKMRHANAAGKPVFGVHFVPENQGLIRLNDPVILLD